MKNDDKLHRTLGVLACGIAAGVITIPAAIPQAATAQTAQASAPVSAQPVPDDLELAKLIWTTMAAIDQANQAGNYSVLRDLAAPGFQINNDAARLGAIFADLRAMKIDLSNSLLLGPTYTAPTSMVSPGVMHTQGYFGLRPTAIAFDLYFQWVQGRWRLYGVSITPRTIASVQPDQTPPRSTQSPPKR